MRPPVLDHLRPTSVVPEQPVQWTLHLSGLLASHVGVEHCGLDLAMPGRIHGLAGRPRPRCTSPRAVVASASGHAADAPRIDHHHPQSVGLWIPTRPPGSA